MEAPWVNNDIDNPNKGLNPEFDQVCQMAIGYIEKARQKGSKPFFIKPITDKLVDGILNAYYGYRFSSNLSESFQVHNIGLRLTFIRVADLWENKKRLEYKKNRMFAE